MRPLKIRPDAMPRRTFLRQTALLVGGAGIVLHAEEKSRSRLRAAIIGDTGHGDYGHGLDAAFADLPNVEVVALADPDPKGRALAAKKANAARSYSSYQEMLEKEKPQLVAIAPRWTDQHHAMAMAAIKAGAHICIEKPFTTTLAEADEILAAADQAGLKIAIAHQIRLAPNIVEFRRQLKAGLLGDLLEIRSWGKQDDRAGGEDLLVLGTHLFDLMRSFAGEPEWCTARLLHEGREFSRKDARFGKEKNGPLGGNEIEAQFAFPRGIFATFTSRAKLREAVGHWGMELIGSKSSMRILMDVVPALYEQGRNAWKPEGRSESWTRWKGDTAATMSAEEKDFGPANRRVVQDWLEAIRTNREPASSGRNGMKAIEMVMAIYQAGLNGRRISFPLADRKHPLG